MRKTFHQIRDDLLALGLQDDGRPIYAEKYQPYFSEFGAWQQPAELASLLHYLQKYEIQSFLSIGTFNGRTFNFIADFLTALNPAVRCVTVDIENHPRLERHDKYEYVVGTSELFTGQSFDLVFIDGDHAKCSAAADFEHVGRHAKFCVFHDIDDDFVRVDYADGGIPAFWEECRQTLKDTHDNFEFIANDKPNKNMGIGLLVQKHVRHNKPLRRIIVTPAGREGYLTLLWRHLSAQKDAFDEWHLWLNTQHQPDIDFCQKLATDHAWIKTAPLTVPWQGNGSICSFFPGYADPDCVYMRLDDDVIWLSPNFVAEMFEYRIAHPEYCLVYPTIINNSIISHLFQRCGALTVPYAQSPEDLVTVKYDVCDLLGWHTPLFANNLHKEFLASLETERGLDRWRCFDSWNLFFHERVSINSISWLGSTFAKFCGNVGHDEETWLSCVYPATTNTRNIIINGPICAHFSFYPQRGLEFQHDELLAAYAKFAPVLQ